MRRGLWLGSGLLWLVAVAGWAEDWPMLRRDAARSGIVAEAWTLHPLEVAWSVTVDEESVDASPAVVGSYVYVGTATGRVVCLRAENGAVVWQAHTGGAVMSSPAVAAGCVIVGSADRCIYAFAAEDGKQRWRVRTRGAVVASPLIVGERVYIGSMDGTFRCLRVADGKELWRTQERGGVSASAAGAGELIYLGDEAGTIVARNAADGQRRWSVETAGSVVAAPLVVGERLVVPIMSPTALAPPEVRCLLVLDRHTGQELWSLKRASSVLHTPISDGVHLYFATVSGYLSETELLAFMLEDGTALWKRRLGGVADSSPLIVGGTLLIGCHDENLYVVDKSSGEVLQTVPLGGKIFSSPAWAEGRVFIGRQGGHLVCLR